MTDLIFKKNKICRVKICPAQFTTKKKFDLQVLDFIFENRVKNNLIKA